MINKPITVARQDFIENLVAMINGSGLPAFIIIDILKSCQAEMGQIAETQYKKDLEAYKKLTIPPESEVISDADKLD